jgi:hypothetical protein
MTDAARSGGQHPGPQRPLREIPPDAAIPPPDPHWTTPVPGYPGADIPGAVAPGEEIPSASFPDSAPETYRPGQQP